MRTALHLCDAIGNNCKWEAFASQDANHTLQNEEKVKIIKTHETRLDLDWFYAFSYDNFIKFLPPPLIQRKNERERECLGWEIVYACVV